MPCTTCFPKNIQSIAVIDGLKVGSCLVAISTSPASSKSMMAICASTPLWTPTRGM